MSFESLLTKTCSILRQPATPVDGFGTPSAAFAAAATGIPCRIVQRPATSSEGERPAQTSEAFSTIFLPFGTDVTARDQIQIGDDIYAVTQIYADAGGQSHHAEVQVRKLQ